MKIYERNFWSRLNHTFVKNILLKMTIPEERHEQEAQIEDSLDERFEYEAKKKMVHCASISPALIMVPLMTFFLLLNLIGMFFGVEVIPMEIFIIVPSTLSSLSCLYLYKYTKLQLSQKKGVPHEATQKFSMNVRNFDLFIPAIVFILVSKAVL